MCGGIGGGDMEEGVAAASLAGTRRRVWRQHRCGGGRGVRGRAWRRVRGAGRGGLVIGGDKEDGVAASSAALSLAGMRRTAWRPRQRRGLGRRQGEGRGWRRR